MGRKSNSKKILLLIMKIILLIVIHSKHAVGDTNNSI